MEFETSNMEETSEKQKNNLEYKNDESIHKEVEENRIGDIVMDTADSDQEIRKQNNSGTKETQFEEPFKKPVLFQKPEPTSKTISQPNESLKAISSSDSQLNEKNLDYKEPSGSSLPKTFGKDYSLEVLKNGSIIETVNLMKQRYWLFGRLDSCHITMQHPTISRYHAILQYLDEGNVIGEPGFYLYDLGSTHGTFLNKNKLKPKLHVRVKVGHMLKLGCSTRNYILNGPDEDQEEESELSVTELKAKRAEERRKLEDEMKEAERKRQEEIEKEEARGIDWGLGEDADEEVDLSENPYAQSNNEDLFIEDPKKALRGFFEREGLDLQYDCTEYGVGQFLCKVELPVDDEMGKPVIAEVIHKGKKKEAVIQCALEACKILDRHGVLRQASHESRKRKAKNWEENDYYDSDEDTFLDRTGTIEKKREKRMNTVATEKVETYDSLCKQAITINSQIDEMEKKLLMTSTTNNKESKDSIEEDSLDAYMNQLSELKPDKIAINKMRTEITALKAELVRIQKLINFVKPANLPPLATFGSDDLSKQVKKKALPMIGKRKTGKVYLPAKPVQQTVAVGIDDGIEEEDESD